MQIIVQHTDERQILIKANLGELIALRDACVATGRRQKVHTDALAAFAAALSQDADVGAVAVPE